MSDKAHFADLVNFYFFDGEQVIRPDDLENEDVVEKAILNNCGQLFTNNKYRDVVKGIAVKSDGKTTYAVVGIENQSYIDYAMPVRNIVYDALNYESQISEKKKQNKNDKNYTGTNEYLSGIAKGTKIKPVITLVINFSKDKWDGPVRLSDMFGDIAPEIKANINDYVLRLIDPHDIDSFIKFHTELGAVLEFIKRQNEDEYLKKMKEEKGDSWVLTQDSVNMINTFTGAKIPIIKKRGGKINMCRATEALIEEGIEKGIYIGVDIGVDKHLITQISKKMAKGKSVIEIADEVEEDYDKVDEIYNIAIKYAPEFNVDKIYEEMKKTIE
jgi:hypothetical protein